MYFAASAVKGRVNSSANEGASFVRVFMRMLKSSEIYVTIYNSHPQVVMTSRFIAS